MNRREFTKRIATLILRMIEDGNQPVLDYVLRSTEEQQRLYADGKTKCDGVKILSKHQGALAADIYFVLDNDGTPLIDFNADRTADLHRKYHDIWETMGGKPMIEWDKDHYEG